MGFKLGEGEDQQEFTLIPNGTKVNGELIGCEAKVMPFKDRETGAEIKKMEFTFKITDGPYKGRRLYGNGEYPAPNEQGVVQAPRTRAWVTALLNAKDLAPDFEWEPEDLLDLHATMTVGVRSYKKDGEDKQTNYVRWVYPLGEGPQNAPDGTGEGGGDAAEDQEPF